MTSPSCSTRIACCAAVVDIVGRHEDGKVDDALALVVRELHDILEDVAVLERAAESKVERVVSAKRGAP